MCPIRLIRLPKKLNSSKADHETSSVYWLSFNAYFESYAWKATDRFVSYVNYKREQKQSQNNPRRWMRFISRMFLHSHLRTTTSCCIKRFGCKRVRLLSGLSVVSNQRYTTNVPRPYVWPNRGANSSIISDLVFHGFLAIFKIDESTKRSTSWTICIDTSGRAGLFLIQDLWLGVLG